MVIIITILPGAIYINMDSMGAKTAAQLLQYGMMLRYDPYLINHVICTHRTWNHTVDNAYNIANISVPRLNARISVATRRLRYSGCS